MCKAMPEVVLDEQPFLRNVIELSLKISKRSATGLLGLIHSGIRIAHEDLGIIRVIRADGDADTSVEKQFLIFDEKRPGAGLKDAICHNFSIVGLAKPWQYYRELVPTESRDSSRFIALT